MRIVTGIFAYPGHELRRLSPSSYLSLRISFAINLISVRSRGNFKRPFVVVDEIEKQAEAETADKIAIIDNSIANYNAQLQSILSSAKEGQPINRSSQVYSTNLINLYCLSVLPLRWQVTTS